MALSWNEIKDRAVHFSKEWENAFNEEAAKQPDDFKFRTATPGGNFEHG